MTNYLITVFWSDQDRSWVADIPDLKHCSAFGQDPLEAVSEVVQAKEAWLESAREQGDPIPPPRARPSLSLAG